MMPLNDDLWISEESLADALGVSRGMLVVARAELPTLDIDTRSNFVFWKKSAAEKFAAGLGLRLQEAKVSLPEPETLTVISVPGAGGNHYPNPRVIQAQRKNGERVFVTVRAADKFLPKLAGTNDPMTFLAAKSQIGGGWVLVGREPRWRGRW